ncbi:GDSL-type esterase/lipase family protein [Prevotella sp. 10(H)]|uniref:GDSL-type esterase/lipase family protein n=1 Tax=Prevotella sp. 10(H) TaxID=1158294 RepID=UPI0004A7857E|nr:GDSL-type esterase/lipase family protein [Prevotella sp. 10(H)]
MKYFISLLCCLTITLSIQAQKKIACIGASITEGVRTTDPAKDSYPSQLARLLGSEYKVLNFGLGSRTILRKGDFSYWETKQYKEALECNPDIVFIDLGGNDAKLQNRIYMDEMTDDCKDMIRSFKNLPSNPRIIVMLPFVSFEPDTTQIWDRVIVDRIIPRLQQAAYEENVEVLDMHSLLIDRKDLMPDNIHPEDEGSSIIAKRLYDQVVLGTDKSFDLLNNIKEQYTVSNFKGYTCADFKIRGRECKVVKPRFAAENKPWIWRTRFWAHEPQTDIALLERGFHLVYCDVAELMGNNEALSIWTDFYTILTKAGLSKKSTMEGMSRGAMYSLCWAAANPDKVNCVYIDNPLLDCRYLADKEGDLGQMTKDFMDAYNLKTRDDIRNFKGSPIDKVEDIVKGKYPILILCADQDEAVSPTQTIRFEQKIKAQGGDITVIMKPGFKHHPHSFPNPSPIVDFILKATYKH